MDSRRWDDNHPSSSNDQHYHQQPFNPYSQQNYQQQQQHHDGFGSGGYGYGQHVTRPQKFNQKRHSTNVQSQPRAGRTFSGGGGGGGGGGGSHPQQNAHHSRGHQGRHDSHNRGSSGSRRVFGSETGSNHSGNGRQRGRRDRSNNSQSSQYRSYDDLRSDSYRTPQHPAAGSAGHHHQQQQHHSSHSYRNSGGGQGGGGSSYQRRPHDDVATPQRSHRNRRSKTYDDAGPNNGQNDQSMAANGWSADVDCAFREPTSSTDGQTLNKRTFFGDDDDERNTDADSLIHSILNENAAERMDEIVDTTPSNPLVDLTDADDLLQSFCSAIGDRPSGTDDDADGALTPLTSIDPLLSSTAAPSTPLVPLGVHAKRSIAISTPAAVGTADTQGTKKLINQLTRMNKHNLKQMINNPDGKYATALQTQARRKNREETRKQLRIISSMDTTAVGDVEADEGVDSSSIPSDIFEQIGRVLNVDFSETFPPCDAVAAAVFEPNAALCGDENDFLMERLAEAERAFDADDVVVSDAVATDGSFAGAASDATPSNEQGVAAISIDATLGKTSTMTTTETSVGVTVPPAATGIASSNRQPKDAILLTTEQPSAAEPRNKKNAANIRKIKQIWSWKNNTLKLKKIQFGTELSEDLLKSAIEAKNVERVLILRMIGNTQLGKHLLAGVYTNLPEYTLNNFRATERSFARYKPGCEWELQKEKLDSRRKAKQARLDLKQQSDTLPAHSRKILTLPQLRQLWSAKKQKNAIISQQLLPTLRQSAIDATAEERRHILDHVRVKFRNRLLADHFLNLPELTLKEFQTEERGLARYEPNCEWEQRYQKVCKKNAQREAKQATARFAETASLDLQPNTPEISAIALPQTHDADPPINQTDGNSSKTDYTTTIESDTRPSPVQRSTTITSEATSTSGPKHIRFDEPLAECESAHIAHQPLTTAPAAEPQAATNVPETPTAVPTLVQHTRFDDAADVTITIDDLSQPEPSSTNTESEVSSPPETAPEAAPETAVPTVDSALPAPNSPPASTAPDPTTDVAVVSPLQPAKTAATAARTAATFVECDDGRFAQRLSSTSAELRQTLKQVPKHIRSAISKRLKELNANERRAKRGSQSTSVQSDDDLEEEDVIDVTPATPSVDLTAGDDVDDAGGEIAAATTTPRIPEVVQSSVTIVVPPEPTVPTADSAITDAVPATEPNAAIITTTPATVDSPVPAAIETVSSANVPIPTTTEPVLPPATPSLPPAVIVRTPSPKVVVRTPTPTAIVRTPTPNAIVRTPTPAAIVRTPTPVAEKTRSTPKTSTIPEKKPTEPTDKPNSKSSTSSKSKTKPESNLPVASKTKASVKSTTKSQSRDTSREPPVVGERPSKTTTSSDQRHGCSPGEKKFVVPAKAAASASTGASSASTVPRMPLPIGADPHRTTSSKHSTGKSSVARAVPASDPAVVGKVTVLQRMKEIDRLLVNSMQKKMSIDQQIVELQQKKSDIESAQMRWHEERSQLLASLINGDSSSSSNTAEKKRPAKVPTSTTTAKAKAASTATSNPIISEQISTVAISTIKTESGSSNAGKSTKKRPANGTPIADPVKRRRIKRTIDLTDGDAELDSAARRLFVVGPQLDHILRNPGVVQLARLNIDVIQDAVPDPAIPQLPPIEVSTSDETSLSDGGSQDDASFDGCFFGNRLVIVYVLVIGRYLLAASEDGNVYKYVWRTGEMVATFAQHSQTVTSLVQTAPATILSISLDGFVRQFQLKKFEQQVEAFSVGEPLQTIVYNWNTAFVGCKSGKIAVLHRSEENRFRLATQPLCTAGMTVMSLVATKEGPRCVLIVGARHRDVTVRDALTGLLLRTIALPDKTTAYSLLLDAGVIYCGTNHNRLLSFDFANGKQLASKTLALGTICLLPFGESVLLCGCYDGNIYAIDKRTSADICQIGGTGNLLYHFALVKNKIIAATKNTRSLRMCKLPDEVLNYATPAESATGQAH